MAGKKAKVDGGRSTNKCSSRASAKKAGTKKVQNARKTGAQKAGVLAKRAQDSHRTNVREMKDSGVEWLGEIPAGWDVRRAKFVFKQTNDRGNDNLTLLAATQKYGMYPQNRLEGVVRVKEDTDLSKFRTVHKNDFVISLRSFQGGFERSDFEGVCSPAYQTFCAIEPIDYQYFKYLFKSPTFVDHMNSLTLGIREGRTIKFGDFANQLLPLPPLPVQHRIADYLDEKCTEIDRAITSAEQSIEDYKAYKRSILGECFDLDCDRRRIKTVCDPIKQEIPSDKCLSVPLENLISFSGQLVNPNLIEKENHGCATGFRSGDVLFSKLRPYLAKAYLAKEGGACSGEFLVLRTNNDIAPSYLLYYLLSPSFIDTINAYGYGAKMPRVNWSIIGNIKLPLPPLPTQHRIADYLDEKCEQIDNIIVAKQNIADDLKAYKQSLIFEAVTGKCEC